MNPSAQEVKAAFQTAALAKVTQDASTNATDTGRLGNACRGENSETAVETVRSGWADVDVQCVRSQHQLTSAKDQVVGTAGSAAPGSAAALRLKRRMNSTLETVRAAMLKQLARMMPRAPYAGRA